MRTTIPTFVLLVSRVYGSLLGDMAVVQRDDSSDAKMRRYVDSIIEPIHKRQSDTPALNLTQWNEEVLASCSTTLQSLDGASNPAGIAACYNIPFWENSTGVFHADLRLFMISQPTGEFASVSAQDVQVDMSYDSASASSVDNSALRRRSDDLLYMPLPRSELGKRQTPVLTETYAFYGKINPALVGSDPATIKQALIPTVNLRCTNAQGQESHTTLSMSEAAFIVGSLTQQKSVSQANVVSPPLQTLVVLPGQKFVVPGLNILITPVGLIVTGVWAVLLMGTISYGTVRRIQFKDQYRRRVSRVTKGKMITI